MDVSVKRKDDEFTADQLASLIQREFAARFPPSIALRKKTALVTMDGEPDVVVTIGTYKVAVQASEPVTNPTSSSSGPAQ